MPPQDMVKLNEELHAELQRAANAAVCPAATHAAARRRAAACAAALGSPLGFGRAAVRRVCGFSSAAPIGVCAGGCGAAARAHQRARGGDRAVRGAACNAQRMEHATCTAGSAAMHDAALRALLCRVGTLYRTHHEGLRTARRTHRMSPRRLLRIIADLQQQRISAQVSANSVSANPVSANPSRESIAPKDVR